MIRKYYWDRSAQTWVERKPRADRPGGVMVISDSLDGVWNPADGNRYDSKSAYYRAVRQAGGEIIGGERIEPKPREYRPEGIGRDIKRALQQMGG